jgi:dihydrolipoamide dehydrogenase
MTKSKCDLLVVGGGPGGYTAAIRGAQKGLNTILVEKNSLGGTCLNKGCVPTKTLLEDTRMIYEVQRSHFMKGKMTVDFKRLMEKKEMVVQVSREGIKQVLLGNGVTIVSGTASFNSPKRMVVKEDDGGEKKIEAANIVLATGAKPKYENGLSPDGDAVLNTDQALDMKSIPRTLVVVGAGIRGVEFASMYHNLGTKVVIIEKKNRILPRLGWELAGRYKKHLLDHRINVLPRTSLVDIRNREDNRVTLIMETGKGQKEVQTDQVILTGDRYPCYDGLDIKAAGLALNKGILEYDVHLETQAKGVYLVGDATGSPYLAHKAIAQGLKVVDHILGKESGERDPFFPYCIYGNLEVATVGLTEDDAEEQDLDIKVGEFYFIGNGRANTIGRNEGGVTLISDAGTGKILGAHMIGPQSTELISLATLAMQNKLTISDIKKTVFPHPALGETFFEAALASDGEAIHMLQDSE